MEGRKVIIRHGFSYHLWAPEEAAWLRQRQVTQLRFDFADVSNVDPERLVDMYPDFIPLDFPILAGELNAEELVRVMKTSTTMNRRSFQLYGLDLRPSGLMHYHQVGKYRNVIIPLLALIQVSPSALKELLFGKWDFDDGTDPKRFRIYSRHTTDTLDPIFWRLLIHTLNDLNHSRELPRDSMVKRAIVRPGVAPYFSGDQPMILKLELKDSRSVCFDATFEAHPTESGTHPILAYAQNEEQCYVHIWMEDKSPPDKMAPGEVKLRAFLDDKDHEHYSGA